MRCKGRPCSWNDAPVRPPAVLINASAIAGMAHTHPLRLASRTLRAQTFPRQYAAHGSERRLVHAAERRVVHPASGSRALTTVASCDGCCRCFAQAGGRRSAAAVNGCPGYKRTMPAMLEHALTDCATLLRGTAGELCARLQCPCAGLHDATIAFGQTHIEQGPNPARAWLDSSSAYHRSIVACRRRSRC